MKKTFADIRAILTSPERRKFTTLIFLNTLLSIADIGSIALLFVVLNLYSGRSIGAMGPMFEKLNLRQQSLAPALILIVIFLAKGIAGYLVSKTQFRYIFDTASRLTGKNLLMYLEGSYEDHVNIDSAVWVRRICFQPIEFAQYVLACTQQVINESILILVSITALALYNLQLLVIVSLVLLPAILVLSYITKRRLKETRKNIQAANELSLQHLNEAIEGFIESNIYDKNALFIERYTKSQFTVNRFIANMQVTQAIPGRFFETFAVVGFFILIASINFSSSENSVSVFMLGAFVAAAYKIIPGISRIINFGGQIKTYLFTVNELAAQKINVRHETIPFNDPIGKIEMRNIEFAYGNNTVFKDLSCIVNEHSLTGIRGRSGKGKTTLIDILLGFLAPRAGSVFVNGKKMQPSELRNMWPQIAYVKQTAFLLHDTIANNITLYKTDGDKKKLADVIGIAGLAEWIDQLPGGIDTMITEGGKNISGGQRQRIAIARALYKDSSVIILDEPFNELDETSETRLLQHFKKLSRDRIVLLVTHSTHALNVCDHIIDLDEYEN
ncbi:MAG TPA: ABC transporter ATP-binding protein [Parafilimonas sp.]|nr:ABC transporter ATP-binding protein [Parafilimonas sp.]